MLPDIYFQDEGAEGKYRTRVQSDLDRSDVILTPSECAKRDLMKHFRVHGDPIVVHNANLLPAVEPQTGSLPFAQLTQGNYYINLGGYEPRKGLDLLVPVYDRLHREGRVSGPLVIAGQAIKFSEKFRRDLEAAVDSGAVIEVGYRSDQELAVLTANAKALICPSLYEGFGFPPLEAMATGCPVICSDCSSLPEVCGDAAVYVKPNDADGLARAILLMENQPDLRQRLRHEGRIQAARFSWANAAGQFLAALDRELALRSGHHGHRCSKDLSSENLPGGGRS
jgi:alpha-1,3-rhamnosyl/mannosyltransferase